MAFLENPSWQVSINAFIGLLTIVISIIIFRKQQSQKEITFWVLSDQPILNFVEEFKNEVAGRIQTLFDTKPATDIRRVEISVWNSGNTPIVENEYTEPIKFEFGENAEILEAIITKTTPNNMNVSLKSDSKHITLEPFLLNRRDAVTFKVLLAQTPIMKDVNVRTRVVGMNQILDYNKRNATKRSLARIFLIVSYILFILLSIYSILSIYENSILIKLLLISYIMLAGIVYLLVFTIIASFFYSLNYGRKLSYSTKFIMRRIFDTIKFIMDVSKP